MNAFIASAKNVGKQTFGVEAVEQVFLQAWREDTQLMESQTIRSYNNITRLRIKLKQRCATLQDSLLTVRRERCDACLKPLSDAFFSQL
jgi:hypothetical protein